MLDVVVDRAKAWPVDQVWVVLGAGAEDILERCQLENVNIVINDDYDEGLASSLRVGLDALMRSGAQIDGAFVALGDQPFIDPEVVELIADRYEMSTAKALVPKYRYTFGNPVLVDESLWPRLMSLEGDVGAQKLLKAHPEWVEEVWVEKLPPRDVDTAADVEELTPRSAH